MFGDERLAPRIEYALPDPDQERTREERHTGRIRLAEVIAGMREQRLDVTQDVVDRIAADLGVSPAPRLADITESVASLALAPTDVAKIVLVREARAAQGLPPLGDDRDDMTLTQLDERNKAAASASPDDPGREPDPSGP
jgi:hypothetical protein